MAKAKKRSGSRKARRAVRGKRASRNAKKKAAGKRVRAAKPRRRATVEGSAAPGPAAATPIAVPGAWPFPMLSKP
jgi:hypothetical protein